jgi:acyl transferase domain-containing protein
VIKTVLALEKGTIPATVGVKNLNPNSTLSFLFLAQFRLIVNT